MKRPSFQFYPGDWLRATDLRACSVGARGLWMDMLCLMHEGTPYGHLKVGNKVILPSNLARIVGATLSEVEGWLHELQDAGVYSTDENGCISSRRMIRDENIRESRASGGKLGGNPALKVKPKVGSKVNHPSNLQPTPSTASSSAINGAKAPSSAAPLPEWLPMEAWSGFVEMRNASRSKMTDRAKILAIEKLARFRQMGYDVSVILNKSTINNWKDVYEPKQYDAGHRPNKDERAKSAVVAGVQAFRDSLATGQ